MIRFDRLTLKSQEALQKSQAIAEKYNHQQIDAEHLLYALIEQTDGSVVPILKKLGSDLKRIKEELEDTLAKIPQITGGGVGQIYIAPRLDKIFSRAEAEAERLKDEYVSAEHLLIAIADGDGAAKDILKRHGVTKDRIFAVLVDIRGTQRVTDQSPEEKYQALSKYARDLTDLAGRGKLDPVIGRDDEIRRVIQVLSRRTKNNPVLIGEPGVGKTAIAEGVAQRVGAGGEEGAIDASNMLKPALARGELRCVGATTIDEYRKHIEKDAALERRFQPITITEPSVEYTITILRGLKERYEVHHGVRIKDSAIVAAAVLSNRYITDRFLPDKAIDLIDESASRLRIEIDSMPSELDEIERRVRQLEIERQAVKKEKDTVSLERLDKIEKELADLQESGATLP